MQHPALAGYVFSPFRAILKPPLEAVVADLKGESAGATGELQISDVTLEGRNYGFYSQYGTVNIYSGTFIGSSGAIRVGGVGTSDGKYFKVSGGTFSSDISKITTSGYSIESGKSLVDNGDGTWTVKAAN